MIWPSGAVKSTASRLRSNIADDTSLIAEGIVDSTGILEIIAFLESEYGIQISDVDTTPENLETIGRIAAFVARKCASVAGVSTG